MNSACANCPVPRVGDAPLMKRIFLALLLAATCARADINTGTYDMAAILDTSTLETKVIQDWTPMAKDPLVRQKGGCQ